MGGGIIRDNGKCRDLVFLVIFVAFWVAMIVNSSFGFNQGNPLRLTYGLDYKGNVCGNKHANPDLRELEVRYWLNPNQVYQSGLKSSHFSLADAKSICLMECPIPSEDGLNFICDYPEGDIRLSLDDWIDRDYDYFEFLTPDMRNSSLQLQGPCYPIIFPSVNVYWSCQFIARASNISLRHWQQMGGVNIEQNILIDKTSHRAINSPSAVLKEIPFLPVFSSMKRLLRYSLGSVAVGSLVVSIVEWFRFILESLRRRLKLADAAPVSCMGKMMSSSSQCCLGCIDWTIRSVNRNAYIMIAITGKGFFKASAIATGLIMNNILCIGKVNVIGDVILFLGKLCVSLFCALFAFLMLDTHKYKSALNRISSPLFPVLVCWGLGYIVATLFFAVVEMSIDTIILSFCQDAEQHQGTAQCAPPLLMETLDGERETQRLTQGS